MSILRAALDPSRSGHQKALQLLRLAGNGVLEVGVPPQGVRADFRADLTTPLGQQLLGLLAQPGVVELQQLAVPSEVTLPSEDFFPEEPVQGFAEAWVAVEQSWGGGPGQDTGRSGSLVCRVSPRSRP